MKKLIWTLFLVNFFNTIVMAKGFEIQKEIEINVSADQLWEMVGPGFVEVYKWSSNVDHAEGFGQSEFKGAVCSERACDVNVKGFSKIKETLFKYDESNMNLAYEVNDGMPSFVTKAVNDWTVVAIDENRSKLIMNAEFRSKGLMGTLMNGMMERKMTETLETVLKDAKIYAETGKPSPNKIQRIYELEEKLAKAA